jgi:hypothetical protein
MMPLLFSQITNAVCKAKGFTKVLETELLPKMVFVYYLPVPFQPFLKLLQFLSLKGRNSAPAGDTFH